MGGACGTQRGVANVNRTLAGKREMAGIFRRVTYTRDGNLALVNAVMKLRVS
jgi:hypothetical protein